MAITDTGEDIKEVAKERCTTHGHLYYGDTSSLLDLLQSPSGVIFAKSFF